MKRGKPLYNRKVKRSGNTRKERERERGWGGKGIKIINYHILDKSVLFCVLFRFLYFSPAVGGREGKGEARRVTHWYLVASGKLIAIAWCMHTHIVCEKVVKSVIYAPLQQWKTHNQIKKSSPDLTPQKNTKKKTTWYRYQSIFFTPFLEILCELGKNMRVPQILKS